jgi:hypothetical protein
VRYAGGVTFQVIEQLALLVDVIGSSNLRTDRVSTKVPVFAATTSATAPPPATGFTRISTTLNTDIVDLAVGLKVNLVESAVGFVTVFLPLNDDGLRSDLVPAVGLEVNF